MKMLKWVNGMTKKNRFKNEVIEKYNWGHQREQKGAGDKIEMVW